MAVVAAVASGASAVALESDVIPSLSRADVCPGTGDHCWPPTTSARLHRAGADGEVILPGRAESRLYLAVPRAASLEIEHADDGTALVVSARTDSGAPREVYRRGGDADGGSWQVARLDLSAFAGKMIRLDFHPQVIDGRAGASPATRVRRAVLRGDTEPSGTPLRLERSVDRPNVVIFLIDTLRADHLGCYGQSRPTSPRIDAFATSAVLFRRAVAPSSWTLPSTASLLTGLAPNHHGALELGKAIRAEVPTLAETLALHGYRTGAFVTNYLGSGAFGHARGFQSFHFYPEDADRRPGFYLPADAVRRRVERWLDRGRPREPFLLYAHVAEPHWPYVAPTRYVRPFLPPDVRPADVRTVIDEHRPFFMGNAQWGSRPAAVAPERRDLLERLYDGEVRRVDESFGRLVDALGRRGLLERTVIVLTSDHGEEFLDHGGMAHGQTLYDEVVHIPLLVRLPGGAGGGIRVDRLARLIDVMPTVLDAAGAPIPAGLDGQSLFVAATPDHPEDAYATLRFMGADLESVTAADWKVISNGGPEGSGDFEVFDLGHDPHERHNLDETAPVLLGYGRRRLFELEAAAHPGPPVAPALLERLRALGYLKE